MRLPARLLLRQTLGAVRREVLLCLAAGLSWQTVAVAVPWVFEQVVDRGILAGDLRELAVWSGVLVVLGVIRWAGDASLALVGLEARWVAVAAFIPAAGIAAGLWVGGQRALDGAIGVGAVVAFAGWMVLLLDDTTSALDSATEGEVMRSMRRYLPGSTPRPVAPAQPVSCLPARSCIPKRASALKAAIASHMALFGSSWR